MSVLVFGTICLDRVMRVPRLPSPGGYVEIESERVFLGGEGANTANALKQWGHPVLLVGNGPGNGSDASILRGELHKRGLSVPPESEHRTPVCDIYVTPDGERTMFGRGFSTMEPGYESSQIPFENNQWFTAEPNMSVASREVSREAIRRGMRMYLMDFLRNDEPIAAGSFWQSSTDWAGARGDEGANIEWVNRWVDRYGCFAVLSDGPRGFVAGSPEHPARHYPPFPAPALVDTTGAGDGFRAGMLHGLDLGWPVEKCLAFASAAGSLACGYLGATEIVPGVEEIQALIEIHPGTASQYVC